MSGNNLNGQSEIRFNNIVEEVSKLQNSKKYRQRKKVFFAEGVKNFVEAVDNSFDIELILYSKKLLTSALARKFVRQKRRQGVPGVNLSPEQFRTISKTERASGISAIIKERWASIDSLNSNKGLCWNVLGMVNSPGNFGTLIRSSEAASCAGFILLDDFVDPYAPVTIRASTGAMFRQNFIRTDIRRLRSWMKKHPCEMVGASPDGEKSLHTFDFKRTRLLMLGEERQGLTKEQREMCRHLVRIPMTGRSDSLNLGVAGSLFMYEIFRNRSH